MAKAQTTTILPEHHYTLVLNAGTATLKWALYLGSGQQEVGRGVVERIGLPRGFTEWRLLGRVGVQPLQVKSVTLALAHVFKMLVWHKFDIKLISHVGYRFVHGGSKLTSPTLLNKASLKYLRKQSALAPLHLPVELDSAEYAIKALPGARHVGCFDTAWYKDLPEESRCYALPLALTEKYGLKRYGFHGISHAYVAQEAAKRLGKKLAGLNLITCHLGSGCSVTAVRAGRAIDTSMGLTPLEGLVMGTRSGDLDPGLVLFLLKQRGMTVAKLEHILLHESGLKGVAGVEDMREVLVRAGYEVLGFRELGKISPRDMERAKLALNLFLYRARIYLASYAGVLGKVDAIVFTGGIGERNEVIRNLIMRGLPTLKNVPVLAIAANEELAIAKQIVDL